MATVLWILSSINKIITMFTYSLENKVSLKAIFNLGVTNSFIINIDVNGHNCNHLSFTNVIHA